MGACIGMNARPYEKKHPSDPDSFWPSKMSYGASTPSLKGFAELNIATQYAGTKKILVLCTSKRFLEMQNGKFFTTGHQTSEIFVPMYHMEKCGFTFDMATPDGSPVAIEDWTYPMATGYEDKLRQMASKVAEALSSPLKMTDIALDLEKYAAVFCPGGHGPVIEQPKIEALGAILRAAHQKSLPTISLCHGPAAFRAAAIGGDFPYKGYKLCLFPDKADKSSPSFGYLPGQMKAEDMVEAALVKLGMLPQNKEMDDSTCVDRELITGASQQASQTVAVLACKALAEKYDFKIN